MSKIKKKTTKFLQARIKRNIKKINIILFMNVMIIGVLF